VDGKIVAEGLERLARKGVVDALSLLQTHYVGLTLGEPSQSRIEALFD
jgi:hypothetical protein